MTQQSSMSPIALSILGGLQTLVGAGFGLTTLAVVHAHNAGKDWIDTALDWQTRFFLALVIVGIVHVGLKVARSFFKR